MSAEDIARRIQRTHVPTSDDGWATCQVCQSGHHTGTGEWQPVFPCDARALADAVAGPVPAPEPPEQTVHLYEKSRFPNWDRGPYIGEVPLSEAQARAEAEGAVYFEEKL